MDVILQTKNLTKKYGNKIVVDHVSMTICKGDIYGFIGKNGAGKTTLIRMVCGLAKPTIGNLSLFGSDHLVENRAKLGTVIESPALFPNMTARENLIVQCKLQNITDLRKIDEILELVGLHDTNKKKAKNFSLGMRQRLAIAIALIGEPELLILDEPTNGLDPEGIKEIRELIVHLNQAKGLTVLISSHILGELSKFATRYGIIHKGKLIEELTEEDLWKRCSDGNSNEPDLEEYFLKAIGGR